MAKFIKTDVRSAVNPAHIVEVDDYNRAHLSNGEERTLHQSYWDGSPIIVPAREGYTLLRFYYGDNEPSLDKVQKYMEKLPIIAWKADQFMVEAITPVTAEDEPGNKIEAVQFPDGQVAADGSCYRLLTFNEWVEEVHTEWHKHVRDEWEDPALIAPRTVTMRPNVRRPPTGAHRLRSPPHAHELL